MSIIEQAAKRLEELNRAGVNVPWGDTTASQVSVGAGESSQLTLSGRREHLKVASAASRNKDNGHGGGDVQTSSSVNLDLERLEKNGFLVPALVRSQLAVEFRHIKRPLLKAVRDGEAAAGKYANIIMVSSALAGEGKTFCAINLAMSIAMEVDSSVLLIDADVLRPSVLPSLGLSAAEGLLDLLEDPKKDLAGVLLRTNVAKLTLLPAGRPNANSTELLASVAMENLLGELATRYSDRIIVIDTPPLLLTTESRVLAAKVGQILMVIEASRTTQSDIVQAFAAVEQCPFVYSILNKCAVPDNKGGYGYYDYG